MIKFMDNGFTKNSVVSFFAVALVLCLFAGCGGVPDTAPTGNKKAVNEAIGNVVKELRKLPGGNFDKAAYEKCFAPGATIPDENKMPYIIQLSYGDDAIETDGDSFLVKVKFEGEGEEELGEKTWTFVRGSQGYLIQKAPIP